MFLALLPLVVIVALQRGALTSATISTGTSVIFPRPMPVSEP